MDLLIWTERYIDYANSFRHDLLSKDIHKGRIECRYKKGSATYIIRKNLDKDIFAYIEDLNVIIVCLNDKKNLNFLCDNWPRFIKNKTLKIIFSNPKTNEKWVICPYTHNLVTEPSTLKKGLKSMYESITPI